jgi:uracil-DNA glycosylase family 4
MNIEKEQKYFQLINKFKFCNLCGDELLNPSNEYEKNGRKLNHLGMWAIWQGNINSEILIVGQDWGDDKYLNKFIVDGSDDDSTCKNLAERLKDININIEVQTKTIEQKVFLTNSILCIKKNGKSGTYSKMCQKNCGNSFLKPLIELIKPTVIITLGEKPYKSIMELYDKKTVNFKSAVENNKPVEIISGVYIFPVYHCSQRIINTHTRIKRDQIKDWKRIGNFFDVKKSMLSTNEIAFNDLLDKINEKFKNK